MTVRSILMAACALPMLMASPALASYQGTQGGCCGTTGSGDVADPGSGSDSITAPDGTSIDPGDLHGGFSGRGDRGSFSGDPDDGASGVGHDGVSGNSNSPDGPGSGNGK